MTAESKEARLFCFGLFAALVACSLIEKWRSSRTDKNQPGDAYYQIRFQSGEKKENRVIYFGTCHCQRVNFKVLAPRSISAVDIPSKIRFPRVSVEIADFELLTDPSVLSVYFVQQQEEVGKCESVMTNNSHQSSCAGAHSFCSFCGMHVMFSPTLLGCEEVQINLDCLNKEMVCETRIVYHSVPETRAVHPSILTEEESTRLGVGYWNSPSRPFPDLVNGFPAVTSPVTSIESAVVPLPTVRKTAMNSSHERGMGSFSFANDHHDSPDTTELEDPDSASLDGDDCSNLSSSSFNWPLRNSVGESRSRGGSRSSFSLLSQSSPDRRIHSGDRMDYSSYQQMRRFLHRHMDERTSDTVSRRPERGRAGASHSLPA